MGVSLSYISTHAVAPETVAAIKNDAVRINSERRWWCEPLSFRESLGYDDKLTGRTKLFLPGYSTGDGEFVEVDPTDDGFMAARDARFIIDQLARWSHEYGVDWRLELEGGEIGAIQGGEVDPELLVMIEELSSIGDVEQHDASPMDDEERARQIDETYIQMGLGVFATWNVPAHRIRQENYRQEY